MHEQRPSEPDGDSLPPTEPPVYRGYAESPERKPAWRTGAGLAGGAALFFGKIKALLFLLLNFKWLVVLPKFAFSFGSLFVSIWLYALFFGWKFGIVFVLLLLVHELGHYLTFRNFGIPANLPFFIPLLGAFVARRGPAPSLTVEAIATLAGPVFGVGASAICFGYGVQTHQPFWIAAAYVGFFLNALNLLPVPPLDGGGIAAAIDPRLWIGGLIAFVGFVIFFGLWSPFTVLIMLLIAFTAVPRIRAIFRGVVDPRLHDVSLAARWGIAAAYFVVFAIAVAGALAAHIDTQALTAGTA